MKSIKVLGVRIDVVDMEQAVKIVLEFLRDSGCPGRMVVTPNPEMIIRAHEDGELFQILNRADLSLADGSGVVLASRFLKKPLPERVAGFDLITRLFEQGQTGDFSVYFLGGEPGVAHRAAAAVQKRYQGLQITGVHHGYLDSDSRSRVISEINRLQPDLLLVGMGMPLQEKFLDRYLDSLKVKVGITVGGSFDVLAGEVNRAPLWIRRFNLEWCYRLLQEPTRLARMTALPRFLYRVLKESLSLSENRTW